MRMVKTIALSVVLTLTVFLIISCAPGIETSGYEWRLQFEADGFTFWDVHALDDENVWAVGFDGDYKGAAYYFDGSDWSLSHTFEEKILTVFAQDEEHVWAAGEEIYFYDGTSWSTQYRPGETINGIAAVDAANVWAVGDEGGIYFFDGDSWVKQHQAAGGMFGVSAADRKHVWAVGQGEDLLFYDGSNWGRSQSLSRTSLFSVFAVGDDLVWAVGSHEWIFPVYESDLGYPHSGYVALFDGSSWSQDYRADESLFDISAPGRDRAWAAGERHVYFHDGSSWSKQYSYGVGIHHVSASDPGHVWVVGGPSIYAGVK